MNTNEETLSERDEIEMLLPWYVTGKLEAEDTARVEAYLADHPDMQDRLARVRAERDETVFLNEAAQAHAATSASRFMTEVAGRRPAAGRRVVAWIEGLLPLPPAGALRWTGIAAVLVILAQAAVIFMLAGPQGDGTYRQAAGTGQTVTAGTAALVRFSDTASVSGIAKLLSDLDMVIVEGPKAGGLFKVRIGPEDMSEAERERRIKALTQRKDLVVFATVTR